jgi:hypothetical protein
MHIYAYIYVTVYLAEELHDGIQILSTLDLSIECLVYLAQHQWIDTPFFDCPIKRLKVKRVWIRSDLLKSEKSSGVAGNKGCIPRSASVD